MKWNIRKKIILILLLIGLVPLASITYFSFQKVNAELISINKNRLIALGGVNDLGLQAGKSRADLEEIFLKLTETKNDSLIP